MTRMNMRPPLVLALGVPAVLSLLGVAPLHAAPASHHVTRARVDTASAGIPGISAPPSVKVLKGPHGDTDGFMFITPQVKLGDPKPHGAMIVDNRGRPVWFRPLPAGQLSADLRVQRYRGRPVLTWWQGTYPGGGVGYIANTRYRTISTIKGISAPVDLHEFSLTSRGTALLIEYKNKTMNLSALGGPAKATVVDGIVEEIDVATGRVVWRWSSLEHVPIKETYLPRLGSMNDYIHLNSVVEDTDGNLLISARHTSTIYKVSRRTGHIMWKLGGRDSTFAFRQGAHFAGQHNAVWEAKNLIRVFDNAIVDPTKGPVRQARVAWIRIDPDRRTATLVKEISHPGHMSASTQGGAQALRNGDTTVSWGSAGRISQFSRHGRLLFDASLPSGYSSYRMYRFPWKGRPATRPKVIPRPGSLRVTWNGATDVARWRILAGAQRDALKLVAKAAWRGFDMSIPRRGRIASARYLRVQAVDSGGRVLGSTLVTRAAG